MAQRYRVKDGDTVEPIAQKFYGDSNLWHVIAAANHVCDPKKIFTKEWLIIPDIIGKHLVEPGDTFSALALKYYGNADLARYIAMANGRENPHNIGQPGWMAVIPELTEQSHSVLESSARQLQKATHVPITVAPLPTRANVPSDGADGLTKITAIRQLALMPGDTRQIRSLLASVSAANRKASTYRGSKRTRLVSDTTFDVLEMFEQPVAGLLQPDIAAVSQLAGSELMAFAEVLVDRRLEQLQQIQQVAGQQGDETGKWAVLANAAIVAVRGLRHGMDAPNVGMLNLERIEMTPAGIQRGELVSTIPLAPGEETAVTYTEWSVTNKEFTTIVTDSLENVSEVGVTDNTELSQSTTSQTQHSNQFNITGTVQAGIPAVISGSASTNFTAQDSDSTSATESIKHARTLTQKASSRSRQEHKVTVSTKTETGTQEASTRVIKNPGNQPIRIDYFSLMRKWRVALYRYGLRLTYDIVIPEPGAAMRRAYARLDDLHAQQGPFTFKYTHYDMDQKVNERGEPDANGRMTAEWLADKYGATVRPFPKDPDAPARFSTTYEADTSWYFKDLPIEVPDGTRVKEIHLFAEIDFDKNGKNPWLDFEVIGAVVEARWQNLKVPVIEHNWPLKAWVPASAPQNDFLLQGGTGKHVVTFFSNGARRSYVELDLYVQVTEETKAQWRNDVWSLIFNAAQARYIEEQQQIAAEITELENQLLNVDTLTLRREENDEIMKCILLWVLGPTVFMSDGVLDAYEKFTGVGGLSADKLADELEHGTIFDETKYPGILDQSQLTAVGKYSDILRFINQAIEWENVATFLYSYFWDVPDSWTFIRQLRHPDPTRQAFLRAGAARVVLTVRKGWEGRWAWFTKTLEVPVDEPKDDPSHPYPYLTIAQEIAAYDSRNYPGISPANPAKTAVRLQDAVYTTSADKIPADSSQKLPLAGVRIKVESSVGFLVGLPVVLDTYDYSAKAQESPVITDIPDATHITVDKVEKSHDGSKTPFAVIQPGEKGTLIAEWNEYTPSSGTDIAITSNLETIA